MTMISKNLRPVIGNLITGKLGSSGLMDQVGTSPRTPLDFKIQSPRGLKNYYDLGVVGLGIVVALEKSGHGAAEFHGKNSFCSRNFNLSEPIPVNSAGVSNGGGDFDNEMGSLEEEFTYVTRRNPDKSSYTRVYRDGYEYYDTESRIINRKINAGGCLFDITPAKFCDFTAYPDADFLSSCQLCKKNLHGKDIYMYRGEKAFCSMECRYRQIVKDEQKEKCSSEASSRSISSSPCSYGGMFSTGIFAI